MSLTLLEFKDNLNTVIAQSNSYEELCDTFQYLVSRYNIGKAGDDIFDTCYNELVRLIEKERLER